MHALTVFYLHTRQECDEVLLQEMAYGLSDVFRAFCRETFTYDEPLDYPVIRIIPVQTPKELDERLFLAPSARSFLSDDAKHCIFFMLDDALCLMPDGSAPVRVDEGAWVSLNALCLDGLTIQNWLFTYFPALPKVVLTHAGRPQVALPSRRWVKKPVEVFANTGRYGTRIEHLFSSFWMPHFWHALQRYVMVKAGTNWHTPGHNGGNAFERSVFLGGFHDAYDPMIFRSDLSVSVESLGDLSTPEGHTPLSEAQRLTSEIFCTAQSYYVTNGSSTSNKAMLMTLLRPGETVLLDRNCHKSVHHAVVMAGAVPRYLPAHYNRRLGIWGPVPLEEIEEALNAAPDKSADKPRMLVLTTCTYEGILYPVWEIARLCEERGIIFYADEAWAPYLNFHPFYTTTTPAGLQVRYNAVNEEHGAHFAVQSTHKALAAFSQASMIHVSIRFRKLLEGDNPRFKWLRQRFALHGHGSYEKFSHDLHEVLRYWHSTSPHYPTLATLDMAGIHMRLEGLRLIEERLHWVAAFKARVAQACGIPEEDCFAGLEAVAGDDPRWRRRGYMHDPLKMMLSFRSPELCSEFKKLLQGSKIQWEKSTPVTILFLVTVGTVEDHFEYLFRCIRKMRSAIGRPEQVLVDEGMERAVDGQAAVLPRDAALCDGELVQLEETEGRICSQLLVPYPPGIPVFIPGLRITRAMIALIQHVIAREGASAVHGLFSRGKRHFVEVIRKDEEKRVHWIENR